LSRLHAPKERLKRTLDAAQGFTLNIHSDGRELRVLALAQSGQLSLLVVVDDSLLAEFPRIPALLQSGVIGLR
jgi:hypothetical protein